MIKLELIGYFEQRWNVYVFIKKMLKIVQQTFFLLTKGSFTNHAFRL